MNYFKTLEVEMSIGVGCGLLVIAVLLVVLAAFSMGPVRQEAFNLNQTYIPQVKIAGDGDGGALMYKIRVYTYAGDMEKASLFERQGDAYDHRFGQPVEIDVARITF